MDEGPSHADLFRWFVLQQQQMVMLNLGKLVNPVTGKVERDLDAARLFIDLLGMFEAKTRGNLDAEEERFLGQVLTNLRLNFVEEAARRPQEEQAVTESDAPAGGAPAGDGKDEDLDVPPSRSRPAEA